MGGKKGKKKKKTSLYEVEDHRFGGNAVNNVPVASRGTRFNFFLSLRKYDSSLSEETIFTKPSESGQSLPYLFVLFSFLL